MSIFKQFTEYMPDGASLNIGIVKGIGGGGTSSENIGYNSGVLDGFKVYSNPYIVTTRVEFNLNSGSKVEIKIINLKGQTIKTLESATLS